jgi:hypothetical protein
MTMAGIAPEDDDGNAASKAAPKQQEKKPAEKPKMTDAQRRDWVNAEILKCKTADAVDAFLATPKIKSGIDAMEPEFQVSIQSTADAHKADMSG